jgi:hypothetical protein
MKNDAVRVAMYNAKTVATTVSLKVAALLSEMKTAHSTKIVDHVNDDIAIQSILNADGAIPLYQYSLYYNFGREVRAAKNRGVDSAAMIMNATSLKAKYLSYGCTAPLLVAIALDVFTFVLP